MLDGLQNAGNQRLSKGDAFAVNVGVVAAGEIDALEAAGGVLCGIADSGDLTGPVALDDEGVTGLELFHIGRDRVEGRLDDGPLGGRDDDLIVLVPKTRADAIGVAGDEGLSCSNNAPHYIAAIPIDRGTSQDVGHVEVVRDEPADFRVFVAIVLELAEGLFHFFIEEVADLLQDRDRVGLLFGVLSEFNQLFEELVDVGQVEVAGEGEGPAAPIVLAEERVHPFNGVPAVRAVAQVAEKDLAGEGVFPLEPIGVFEALWVVLPGVGKPAHYLREEVFDRLLGRGPGAAQIALARRYVEFDVGQAHAVLPAVALLLHQEVHLVQAIESRPVGVDVVLERLLEPEQRDAALVLEEVTHRMTGQFRWREVSAHHPG